jgi:PPOX class probable F420-dependent enzyme
MAATKIELTPRIQRRLASDLVIWFATVGTDGHPHAVPVWFWWDGLSFLIYSLPGQKVRDIRNNPNVQLHLNTSRDGDFVVRFDGTAEILGGHPPAYRIPKYLARYRERIKGYGWTPKGFSDQYHVAIRVRPARVRS